jgi:excisionase family DNA binding protein
MRTAMMLTIKEAAKALSIHPRKVYRLANKLGLPKHGSVFIVTEEDLKKMMAM